MLLNMISIRHNKSKKTLFDAEIYLKVMSAPIVESLYLHRSTCNYKKESLIGYISRDMDVNL